MPAIDPYFIDFIEADHVTGNTNFNLKSSLKSTELKGLATSLKITRVALKLGKKFGLKAEVKLPSLQLNGDYTMKGQILVLPILGSGKTNITLANVTGLVDIKGDFFDKNGDTYINVTSLSIKLSPNRAFYVFENIFKGDRVLSDTINSFMNENWKDMLDTLLPQYLQKLSYRFQVVANQLFHNIPMKKIFLD